MTSPISFTKEDIINTLETLPDAIKSKEELLLSETKNYEELNLKQKSYEQQIIGLVYNQTDAEGKKKFTNDIVRKSEVSRLLKDDKSYINLTNDLITIKNQLDIERINHDHLKRLFRAREAMARLMGC